MASIIVSIADAIGVMMIGAAERNRCAKMEAVLEALKEEDKEIREKKVITHAEIEKMAIYKEIIEFIEEKA